MDYRSAHQMTVEELADQPDVARVASGLTPNMKAVILGDPDRLEGAVADILSLCLRNVATVRPDNTAFLTPLGIAVRNHINSEAG